MSKDYRAEAYTFPLHVFRIPCECSPDCKAGRWVAWFPDTRFSVVTSSDTPQGAMEEAYDSLGFLLEVFDEEEFDCMPSEDAAYVALRDTEFQRGRKYELICEWREVEE